MWISPSKRLRRCDDIIIVRDFVHSQNKCKHNAIPFPFLAIVLVIEDTSYHSWVGGTISVRQTLQKLERDLKFRFIHLSHYFFCIDPSLLFPFTLFLVITRRLYSEVVVWNVFFSFWNNVQHGKRRERIFFAFRRI